MKQYHVDILLCSDGSYYTGVTSRLECPVGQHVYGSDPNAYTFLRRPVTLVWSQEFSAILDAIRAEKQIQGWSRAKKQALIAGNWNLIRRLSQSHASTGSA